jgi:hypothetical protein
MRRLPGLVPNPVFSRGSAAATAATALIASSAAPNMRHTFLSNASRVTLVHICVDRQQLADTSLFGMSLRDRMLISASAPW